MSRIKVSYGMDDFSVYFIQQTSLNWIHLLESFVESMKQFLKWQVPGFLFSILQWFCSSWLSVGS